jgi:hypothetical protein
MIKKIVLTLLALPCSVGANSNSEDYSKTAVLNCGAGGVCDQVVNAIGDQIKLNIPDHKIISLGTISSEKKVEITLPKDPGMQIAYSFTPTTGESKGQVVMILFDNIQQKPGTRLFGKSVIKVYRRFTSDPRSTWYELGRIQYNGLLNKEVLGKFIAQITLKTDGTGVYSDPATNKPIVFLAGTKDLSAAAAQEKLEAQKLLVKTAPAR